MDPDGSGGRSRWDHGGPTRWSSTVRLVVFLTVFSVLLGSGYVAGRAGVFSQAEGRLSRQLRDPATRLSATVAFAEQFATDIAPHHPKIPGRQGERACPGLWSTQASTLIGALSPTDAATAMLAAEKQFSAGHWLGAGTVADGGGISASNRRGVSVLVDEQGGEAAASLEVTVTVECQDSGSATLFVAGETAAGG